VFTYLVLVAHYYKAPLPQHLVEKYGSLITDEVKNRFENFLAGTGNEFIGRGAPQINTEAHLRHLKQMNNPVDILRYVKGVVFPGKAFMISKYIESKEQRAKIKDGKKNTSSHHHNLSLPVPIYRKCVGIITSKFWWLWYPYRWWVALYQWQTGAGGSRPAALIASRYLATP
jgi:hypothetical protein